VHSEQVAGIAALIAEQSASFRGLALRISGVSSVEVSGGVTLPPIEEDLQ